LQPWLIKIFAVICPASDWELACGRNRWLECLENMEKDITAVSDPDLWQLPQRAGMQSVFSYAEVTSERLRVVTDLFEKRKISARVGSVLPLAEARRAHEMLAGAPHKSGKIVLELAGPAGTA
jgi:NADPH:quinone reductase-like Zn-dependent oxidoreductase